MRFLLLVLLLSVSLSLVFGMEEVPAEEMKLDQEIYEEANAHMKTAEDYAMDGSYADAALYYEEAALCYNSIEKSQEEADACEKAIEMKRLAEQHKPAEEKELDEEVSEEQVSAKEKLSRRNMDGRKKSLLKRGRRGRTNFINVNPFKLSQKRSLSKKNLSVSLKSDQEEWLSEESSEFSFAGSASDKLREQEVPAEEMELDQEIYEEANAHMKTAEDYAMDGSYADAALYYEEAALCYNSIEKFQEAADAYNKATEMKKLAEQHKPAEEKELEEE